MLINVEKLSRRVLHSDYFPSVSFFIFARTMKRVFYIITLFIVFFIVQAGN